MPRFFAISLLFLAGVCSSAHAALVHRYSFSGNVNDSIGAAHGSIVDPDTVDYAYVGGMLDVQTNRGLPSPQNADGAFVELPGSIFSAAFLGGVAGEITIEMWVEVVAVAPWASPFSYRYTGPAKHLQLYSATNTNDLGAEVHISASSTGSILSATAPLPAGELSHVAITLQTTPPAPNQSGYYGDYSVFINGSLLGTQPIPTPFQPQETLGAQLRLGRSIWESDPFFNGKFDEFRIYDSRLTPQQIAASFAAGPNAVPEPHSISLLLAAATFAIAHRGRASY